jgi:3-oxoacyl-[acyl-carrier protein] reductase
MTRTQVKMRDMGKLDRVALVTGGTRGIGRAIAVRLARDGFAVVISGASPPSVESATAAFARDGLAISGFPADARREEDQRALVEFVEKSHGHLDVLVNNAGIGDFDPVEKMTPERFRRVIETNLLGPYYAIHFAAELMKAGGGGFIVNIGSLASINAFAGGSAYNASKFGLLGLSDAAMLDLRHQGVRVAIVMPGSVATDFGHPSNRSDAEWMLGAEDVARAVADLVAFPDRALPSRIELRPSHPPKR